MYLLLQDYLVTISRRAGFDFTFQAAIACKGWTAEVAGAVKQQLQLLIELADFMNCACRCRGSGLTYSMKHHLEGESWEQLAKLQEQAVRQLLCVKSYFCLLYCIKSSVWSQAVYVMFPSKASFAWECKPSAGLWWMEISRELQEFFCLKGNFSDRQLEILCGFNSNNNNKRLVYFRNLALCYWPASQPEWAVELSEGFVHQHQVMVMAATLGLPAWAFVHQHRIIE